MPSPGDPHHHSSDGDHWGLTSEVAALRRELEAANRLERRRLRAEQAQRRRAAATKKAREHELARRQWEAGLSPEDRARLDDARRQGATTSRRARRNALLAAGAAVPPALLMTIAGTHLPGGLIAGVLAVGYLLVRTAGRLLAAVPWRPLDAGDGAVTGILVGPAAYWWLCLFHPPAPGLIAGLIGIAAAAAMAQWLTRPNPDPQ